MIAERSPEPLPRQSPSRGSAKPRLAPPLPLKSDIKALRAVAASMGMTFIPWQDIAGRYTEARKPNGHHLYREVCVEVARQNGKTTFAKPVIVKALRAGLRVMHIAQTRELPHEMFKMLADVFSAEPDMLPKRRGKIVWPRYAQGQEEIVLNNGGRYRIAAAKTGGARGWANDLVIIDELREMDNFDIISSVQPTLMMAADPLMLYLSNAGDDKSVVLNSVRDRAGKDPNLAYLSWSANPERSADDRRGWAEANPALGHYPNVLPNLEAAYIAHVSAGTIAIFETENLCRSVPTLMPRIIPDAVWSSAHGPLTEPLRPAMGVKVDPEGRRASAVIAWQRDGRLYVRSLAEDLMAPLDVDAFAKELLPLTRKFGVTDIGYDPWTDRDLARHLPNARAVNGADYASAGERFVRAIEGGQLHHDDDGTIGGDLAYTVRREAPNGWYATRADPERPTTSSEAAIRAVWLASKPAPPAPRVY